MKENPSSPSETHAGENSRDFSRYFEGAEWELPPDTALVDEAEKALRQELLGQGWTDKEIGEFPEMAFREALINAIKHGTLEQEGVSEDEKMKRKVLVKLGFREGHVAVTIRDQGMGFNPKKVSDPTAEENLQKSSGRGMLFMNQYSDSVAFNDSGNEVTLLKLRGSRKLK